MNENVVNMAASALTSWKSSSGKHSRENNNNDDDDKANNPLKRARLEPNSMESTRLAQAQLLVNDDVSALVVKPQLKPYPFFYYTDCSMEVDPDPLTPLTFPGRVPNFPAKLHAILSRADLSEIIDWLPHGRSWRVLKPRDFELKIIPKFFEHSKFSSFVRQANGWGFRRITQGPDRNSYYHPLFLRGLPHLCKKMRRPGVSEKKVVDPDLEPDFYKISEIYPVPVSADEESIFLQKTLQSGPKSRMPVITGHFKTMGKAAAAAEASSALSEDNTPEIGVEAKTTWEAPCAPSYQHPSPSQEPQLYAAFAPATKQQTALKQEPQQQTALKQEPQQQEPQQQTALKQEPQQYVSLAPAPKEEAAAQEQQQQAAASAKEVPQQHVVSPHHGHQQITALSHYQQQGALSQYQQAAFSQYQQQAALSHGHQQQAALSRGHQQQGSQNQQQAALTHGHQQQGSQQQQQAALAHGHQQQGGSTHAGYQQQPAHSYGQQQPSAQQQQQAGISHGHQQQAAQHQQQAGSSHGQQQQASQQQQQAVFHGHQQQAAPPQGHHQCTTLQAHYKCTTPSPAHQQHTASTGSYVLSVPVSSVAEQGTVHPPGIRTRVLSTFRVPAVNATAPAAGVVDGDQAAPARTGGAVSPDQQQPTTFDLSQMLMQFPMAQVDGSNPAAASSFAAGFAAAAAHYQQQFVSMMSNMAANNQLPEGFSKG